MRQNPTLAIVAVLLFLTERGDRVVTRLAPRIQALEERLVSELDEDEREQFADFFRRSRRAMHQAGNRVWVAKP